VNGFNKNHIFAVRIEKKMKKLFLTLFVLLPAFMQAGNMIGYDAWGRLRNPSNQAVYSPDAEPSLLLGRGYTGHEHMTQFGLINMNARLYDPAVGRFLSPDPYVQAPNFSQNFNRYSYCLNNPMIYVDESGELAWFYWVGAAVVGGVANLISNWDNVDGFWEGVASFGIGAGAALGIVATGGSGAGAVIGVGAAGGAAVGATNSVVAQTGHNFSEFNNVNWGQVGVSSAVGGVAGAAGAGAGYWASGASFLVNGVSSPVLRSAIVSPLASGAGHVAGGTTANLFAGQSLGDSFVHSFDGIGGNMAIGTAIGIASTVGVSYANGVNPWTGKYDKALYHYTSQSSANEIMNSQLGINEDSRIYLTTDGAKTPLQAQIDLSLPLKNTAESAIIVKPNSIYPKNIILQRNVTGNVYGRGGGGYEMIYKGTIHTKYLLRLK
jgi:RHS repeat-associated protein